MQPLLKPLYTPSTPKTGETSMFRLIEEASRLIAMPVDPDVLAGWDALEKNAPKMTTQERSAAVSGFIGKTGWQEVVRGDMRLRELQEMAKSWMALCRASDKTKELIKPLTTLEVGFGDFQVMSQMSLTEQEKADCQRLDALPDSASKKALTTSEPAVGAANNKRRNTAIAATVMSELNTMFSFSDLADAAIDHQWSSEMGFAISQEISEPSLYKYFSTVRPDFVPASTKRILEKTEAKAEAAKKVAFFTTMKSSGLINSAEIKMEVLLEHAAVLSYDEFDAELIRANVHRLSKGDATLLIDLLLVSIFLGNNYIERAKRTMDPESSATIIESLAVFELKRRRVTSSTITPSRAASSFPKVVLAIRRELAARGILPDSGVDVATPKLFQDLAFAGMSEELNTAGVSVTPFLEDMAKKFIEARRLKDKKLETTDADAIKTMHKFRLLAVKGHKADLVNAQLSLDCTIVEASVAYGFQ